MKALKRVHVNVNGASIDGKITPGLRCDVRAAKGLCGWCANPLARPAARPKRSTMREVAASLNCKRREVLGM